MAAITGATGTNRNRPFNRFSTLSRTGRASSFNRSSAGRGASAFNLQGTMGRTGIMGTTPATNIQRGTFGTNPYPIASRFESDRLRRLISSAGHRGQTVKQVAGTREMLALPGMFKRPKFRGLREGQGVLGKAGAVGSDFLFNLRFKEKTGKFVANFP